MKRNLLYWLAASFVVTVIFGTIYATGQFILRSGADELPVQVAENYSDYLNKGLAEPEDLNTPGSANRIDIAKSLATFAIFYDKDGKPQAGQGELDGKLPEIPKGVLEHAKPQNRVTWQPKKGVRIASVVQANNKGYILAGRNLREVESRENTILLLTTLGWLATESAVTGGFIICSSWRFLGNAKPKKTKKR